MYVFITRESQLTHFSECQDVSNCITFERLSNYHFLLIFYRSWLSQCHWLCRGVTLNVGLELWMVHVFFFFKYDLLWISETMCVSNFVWLGCIYYGIIHRAHVSFTQGITAFIYFILCRFYIVLILKTSNSSCLWLVSNRVICFF